MTVAAPTRRRLGGLPWVALIVALARPAWAYVEAPYALGRLIQESRNILLVSVEKVDKEKNLIVYRKVRDIKGVHPGETIGHSIGRGGFHPREWQTIMAWAAPGRVALMFHNGGAGEMCIDNYWYQVYAGQWWRMSHGEPYLLRTFAGKPQKLAAAVAAILAGREVAVPCMVDGDKNALQLRKAKVQRLRASLKIVDYNAQRDFAGWGAEDCSPVPDMPGFTHFAPLADFGRNVSGLAATDLDGDGKPDLCLFSTTGLLLLHNSDGILTEMPLPFGGGARAADWADADGNGRPDLLLATPLGPRLLLNEAGGFTDGTNLLPRQAYYNLTAGAWLDYDGDARPDVLLADGFRGLRLYRNKLGEPAPKAKPRIGTWYYAGPFDNPGGRGFQTRYPPEQGIDLSKKYVGKNGKEVVWREGKFTDGQVNTLALFGPEADDNSAVYLYRELDFGGAVELPVSLGSDDTLTVWLNRRQLLAENAARGCAPDQNKLVLKLHAGRNALLLKICNGSGEFAFYFRADAAGEVVPRAFEDVTEAAGLGEEGIAGRYKGGHLAVADVNGDGRVDFLFGAGRPGRPILAINTGKGFVAAEDCGIEYDPEAVTPVFGDFNGDGAADLFVPQRGTCRLFRNDGRGRFVDVTAKAGALAKPVGWATSAAWVDLGGGRAPDLVVGCLRGPDRYFRNNGDGTFTDATDRIGLSQRIFNTRAVAMLDINKDGVADLVVANEGQPSAVFLGDPDFLAPSKGEGAARSR